MKAFFVYIIGVPVSYIILILKATIKLKLISYNPRILS